VVVQVLGKRAVMMRAASCGRLPHAEPLANPARRKNNRWEDSP
jgi:hypothetical protein